MSSEFKPFTDLFHLQDQIIYAYHHKPIEDKFAIVDKDHNVKLFKKYGMIFLGVYDGHGGSTISTKCSEIVHLVFFEQFEIYGDVEKALLKTHEIVDDIMLDLKDSDMTEEDKKRGCKISLIGSTSAIAIIRNENGKNILYVANIGDAEVNLVTKKDGIYECKLLTKIHSVDNERPRLQKCGNPSIHQGRFEMIGFARLNVARGFGDKTLKPVGIKEIMEKFPDQKESFLEKHKSGWSISTPHIEKFEIDSTFQYLMVNSDGLKVNNFNNHSIAQLFEESENALKPNLSKIPALMVKAVRDLDGIDDITIILAKFHREQYLHLPSHPKSEERLLL